MSCQKGGKMNIAVIGTGIMGTGIGLTLLSKGHTVHCYNRTRENAQELIAAGGKYFSSPAEAAKDAEYIIIFVWNKEALYNVLNGESGLVMGARQGQIYIDMSTQLPETAKEEVKMFKAKGADFIDAPVHGSKAEARNGGLWIMAGADSQVFAKALPLLKEIGETVHYMGPVGSGCVAKLCGNHLVSAIVASLGESLVMAKKSGISSEELLKLWSEVDFRSPIIDGVGHSMINHEFDVSFHLRTMVKDTELIRNYSESIGVPVLISNIVHELNKVGQNMGWGEQNASAIVKVFEKFAGVE